MNLKTAVWNADAYFAFRKMLADAAEETYRKFQQKLCKTSALPILGVRLPVLQRYAGEIAAGEAESFFKSCVPQSYEEVMVRGLVIAKMKRSFSEKIPYIESFIPQIDNWAVCDSFCMALKPGKQELDAVYAFCRKHIRGDYPYEVRLAVVLMMQYLLLPEYIDDVLAMLDTIPCGEYYVSMAVAWNLSCCFVKFREKTDAYFKRTKIDDITFHRTIQKISDSYRVSTEDKQYLKAMERGRS